ncbi:hypothetical protein N7532_011613 [Penicillium argentinense]|uniref:DUF7907 domain-containing protein n=1 Tax=Penicillium argentinense TaxID=1131581 RepID=A0A9W9EIY6_9EURO|nr:uncharacterized protein N7532_011613 [Penicillium argentinense]KAJ5082570.1 hypothetical protein N7532_011613 [Penicillium argentinense]
MKTIAIVSSLLLLGAAAAQEIQSKPFHLVLQSANNTYNGQKLAACHSGAAIESLCLAGNTGSEIYLNTTKDKSFVESEPMSFYVDPSTNLAMPMFQPSYDQQQVMFDKEDLMGIYSYLGDTITPPTDDKVRVLKNWYLCETNYSAYTYRTLAWVLGNGKAKPQNPSCVKVQVHRRFVQ